MKRLMLIVVMSFAPFALHARDLFTVLPSPNGRVKTEAVSDQARVAVDLDALASGEDVSVNLGGKAYQAHSVVSWTSHKVITSENVNDYVAEVTLEGARHSTAVIRHRDVMAGMFLTPDNQSYELDPTKDGYVLTRVDPRNFHCETAGANTSSVQPLGTTSPSRRRVVVQPKNDYVITLGEFYTPAAEVYPGGQAQMEAMIQAAVVMLNTSFHQSGLTNVSFILGYTGVFQWNENQATVLQQALDAISNSPDISKIRNQYNLNLVGFWYDGGGGIAWAPRTYADFTPKNGFHSVGVTTGLSIAGFVHEVGHNFGGQHDSPNVPQVAADDFLFARGECAEQFQTTMSQCKVNWIPYFSNTDPSLTYDGQPMGDAMHDNVRMLRIGAPLVSEYFPNQISSVTNP